MLDIIHKKEKPKVKVEPGIKPEDYKTKYGIMLLWDDLSDSKANKQLVTWGLSEEMSDNHTLAMLLELLAKTLKKNA